MKLGILIISGLLLYHITWAQVSKESFERAVDFLNCKTVELTLPNENLAKYKEQCSCEEASYTHINKFLTSIGKHDKTIALSDEIESLKKSFNTNWKREEVVGFLTETIFSDKTKYQKINEFANKPERKGKVFDEYKEKLKAELPGKLKDIIQEKNSIESNLENTKKTDDIISDIEQRIIDIERNQTSKGWFGGITSQLIVVSIGISVLFSILTFLIIKYRNDSNGEIPNQIKEYVKKKIGEETFNRPQVYYQSNPSDLRDINNRIRDLEYQINNLNNKLSALTQVPEFTTKNTPQETKSIETKLDTFYLSTPNSDGSFNATSSTNSYNRGASIYRFSKTENSKANFQIDEKDDSIKLALQFPDKNIDPVCDAENAFNPKSTRIVTVQPGEAELQGNTWVVSSKAKIRYEN